MGIMHSEYRDRINHWIRTLKEDFYTPAGTLDWEVFKTMEQLSFEEAGERTYERVEPGYTWGGERDSTRGGERDRIRSGPILNSGRSHTTGGRFRDGK